MKEKISVRFTGENHEVDLDALVGFLLRYSELIGEVNKRVGESDRDIKINVSAIKRGSFIVELSIHETLRDTLFSSAAVGYMAGLVTIVSGVHSLFKWCKGKAVAKSQEDEVKENLKKELRYDNPDYGVIVSVYNEKAIRDIVRDEFKAARKATEIDGVEVTDGAGNVFKADREEVEAMADCETDGSEPVIRKVTEEAALVVVIVGFEAGTKWRFIYHGIPITVTMGNDALLDQVEAGTRFGKGDLIRAKLEITQRYDKSKGAYINQSYKVVEVLELIPAANLPTIPGM